jgi:hypothetical protein
MLKPDGDETHQITSSTPTRNPTPLHTTRNGSGDEFDPLAPWPTTSGGVSSNNQLLFVRKPLDNGRIRVNRYGTVDRTVSLAWLLSFLSTHAGYDPFNTVPVAIS